VKFESFSKQSPPSSTTGRRRVNCALGGAPKRMDHPLESLRLGRRRWRSGVSMMSMLALAACSAASGEPDELGQTIAGGAPDEAHHSVFLLVRHDDNSGGLCTATLIAPNLLLTARHCVSPGDGDEGVQCGDSLLGEPYPASSFIATNDAVPNRDSPMFAGSKVRVPHEEVDTCGFDIALLVLSANVPTRISEPAVPRIDRDVVPGELYTAVGYGADATGDATGQRMRRSGLSVDCEPGTCGGDVEASEFLGETGICSGDSGGPAIDADGKVVGVVSRGGPDCSTPVYGTVTAWQDFLIATAKEAAVLGGYEAPFWATTGRSDPPIVIGGGGAGGAAGAPSSGGEPEPQPQASEGEDCASSSDCGEGLACYSTAIGAAATCTPTCESTAQCSSGKVCAIVEDRGVCVLPSGNADEQSGCSVASSHGSGSRAAWLFGLSALTLLARRRK
jgi:MYXO-CTERM domain-containing protein